jgi:hypothetical protein
MSDLQAIAAKLEQAMAQLRLIRFGEISAVGYGQVLDARCLLSEALGRLDSVRKQRAA